MEWALNNQILVGFGDGTLKPQEKATRAQIAMMMYRFINMI